MTSCPVNGAQWSELESWSPIHHIITIVHSYCWPGHELILAIERTPEQNSSNRNKIVIHICSILLTYQLFLQLKPLSNSYCMIRFPLFPLQSRTTTRPIFGCREEEVRNFGWKGARFFTCPRADLYMESASARLGEFVVAQIPLKFTRTNRLMAG